MPHDGRMCAKEKPGGLLEAGPGFRLPPGNVTAKARIRRPGCYDPPIVIPDFELGLAATRCAAGAATFRSPPHPFPKEANHGATSHFIGYGTRVTLANFSGYSGAADSAGFAETDSSSCNGDTDC